MDQRPKKFISYRQKLVEELQRAKAHLQIWKQLAEATSKFPDEMKDTWAFWYFTKDAHREACLFRLMRLADKHRDALSMVKFLNWVEQNYDVFEKPVSTAEIQQDREDLKSLQSLFRGLTYWRDKHYAHTDVSEIQVEEKRGQVPPLPLRDIEALIQKYAEIINHYSVAFDDNYFGLDYPGIGALLERVLGDLKAGRVARRGRLGLAE